MPEKTRKYRFEYFAHAGYANDRWVIVNHTKKRGGKKLAVFHLPQGVWTRRRKMSTMHALWRYDGKVLPDGFRQISGEIFSRMSVVEVEGEKALVSSKDERIKELESALYLSETRNKDMRVIYDAKLKTAEESNNAMRARLDQVTKERDATENARLILMKVSDSANARARELVKANDELRTRLNAASTPREQDQAEFWRRLKEQEAYYVDKLKMAHDNRQKIAESLRKAEGERHKYRMMYESVTREGDRSHMKAKINQLRQQKARWKRIAQDEQKAHDLTCTKYAARMNVSQPPTTVVGTSERITMLEHRIRALENYLRPGMR